MRHIPSTILLISIMLCAVVLRFLWIDRIPNAISGDELTYVMTTKTVATSGTDISGAWTPLSVFTFSYPSSDMQAELPYVLLYPFIGTLPFTLFTVRLPYILLSIGIVFLLYCIGKNLFDTQTGLVCACMGAINPWLIYIGRTSYECTPAIFFFLLSFYILLSAKGNFIFLSIPALFLAFYSYIATKLLFIPFVFLTLWYAYTHIHKKKFFKHYSVVALATLFLVAYMVLQLQTKGPSRMNEIFLPTNQAIATEVNALRQKTIANPFTPLIDNKYTLYAHTVVSKAMHIFSAPYLFLEGDLFFSLFRHGFFYSIDGIFVIIGCYMIWKKYKMKGVLLFGMVCISTLPHIFHKNPDNFSAHISLLFPFVILLIGFGIIQSHRTIKTLLFKKLFLLTVIVWYAFLTLRFSYIYFFQHPLEGYFDFSVRVVSQYIRFAEEKNIPVIVLSRAPSDTFKKYLFYRNMITKENVPKIQNAFATQTYTLGMVTFLSCESPLGENLSDPHIRIMDALCKNMTGEETKTTIAQLSDAGAKYKIFGDIICDTYTLSPYPQKITINHFAIEILPEQTFCEAFISASQKN